MARVYLGMNSQEFWLSTQAELQIAFEMSNKKQKNDAELLRMVIMNAEYNINRPKNRKEMPLFPEKDEKVKTGSLDERGNIFK